MKKMTWQPCRAAPAMLYSNANVTENWEMALNLLRVQITILFFNFAYVLVWSVY